MWINAIFLITNKKIIRKGYSFIAIYRYIKMSILFLIVGIVIGVILRNIIGKFLEIHEKLQYAERKKQEELDSREFNRKYNHSVGEEDAENKDIE